MDCTQRMGINTHNIPRQAAAAWSTASRTRHITGEDRTGGGHDRAGEERAKGAALRPKQAQRDGDALFRSFVCSFGRSVVRLCVRSFVDPVVRWFVGSSSCVRSFTRSLVQSLVRRPNHQQTEGRKDGRAYCTPGTRYMSRIFCRLLCRQFIPGYS